MEGRVELLLRWAPTMLLLSAGSFAAAMLVIAASVPRSYAGEDKGSCRMEDEHRHISYCARFMQCLWLACRLGYRLLELGHLYAFLLQLGLVAYALDRLLQLQYEGSYLEQWHRFTLRNVQSSGPVFVKLAQWASTRPDLISQSCCDVLRKLQDDADAHPLDHTHAALDNSFGNWSEHLRIEPEPVGSGCMAQVYIGILSLEEKLVDTTPTSFCGVFALFRRRRRRAHCTESSLRHGVRVAVKVIHPQVRRAVDLDLKFLQAAAWCADRLGLETWGIPLAFRQFVKFLLAQADFRIEAKNFVKFRHNCDNDGVAVPEVYYPWVSEDVLVMGFEEGVTINTLLRGERPPGVSDAELKLIKEDLWRQLIDVSWAMIFKHQFVHGDLHPGNIFWHYVGDGRAKLILLDCGLAVDLSGNAGEDLLVIVKALLTQKEEDVGYLLIKQGERVGGRTEDVWDPEGFVAGIADLIRRGKATGFELSKINAYALMGRSLLLGRRHRVRFDTRFVNLMVAMMILQGVSQGLCPDGDFMSRIAPFVVKTAITSTSLFRRQSWQPNCLCWPLAPDRGCNGAGCKPSRKQE